MSVLASLFMVGCSQEELTPDAGDNSNGEPQFLTVNLVTNSVNGTRAKGDPNGTADYENGSDEENAVKKVRFYFFKADNTAAEVKKEGNDYVNYLDWTEISNADKNEPNVEKILSATLVFQSPNDNEQPAKIVAVINPVEEAAKCSLTDLEGVAGNYQQNVASNFVMSNSVYMDNDGIKQMPVSVEGKLHETPGEALNDPVQIYVERTVAKVRLDIDKTKLIPTKEGENIFKTSNNGSQKYGEKEIFVKFLGWNTTAVADKSRLVKEISTAWKNENLGFVWNWAEYHRSFWAINATGVEYQYGDFDGIKDGETANKDNIFQAQAKTEFDGTDWVYVNENAAASATDNAPATPTKVIISAQLVDSEGNPLEFAEYGTERTTIEGLKDLFAENCGLYSKTTEATGDKFNKIEAKDLTIKTATELKLANKEKAGRYKVYVQLTSEAEGMDWYPTNNKDARKLTTVEANQALLALGSAKVWTEGKTYYYFDIKHLGGKNNPGVVRNHIYNATITSLSGLGTPVYNPDEIIYPEQPDKDKDTYIAAQINILSWRVVSNNYDLEW